MMAFDGRSLSVPCPRLPNANAACGFTDGGSDVWQMYTDDARRVSLMALTTAAVTLDTALGGGKKTKKRSS